MSNTIHSQSGYIALMAVLIVGAAATAIALTLLATGSDAQRAGLVTQSSAQTRSLSSACAEEALQQIRDNTSFIGSNTAALGGGSCSYTVSTTGTSTRIIDTSSTFSNVIRKTKLYVTIGASSISVTSWQEVSDA